MILSSHLCIVEQACSSDPASYCYTITLDRAKLGQPVHVVVTVKLMEAQHERYLTYMRQFSDHITSHYRTAGAGCYLVELHAEDNAFLSHFLDGLETVASYQVAHVINTIAKA